jgi:hypothetical protein
MLSYKEVHAARHAAGQTYVEKSSLANAETNAAAIKKERSYSGDDTLGDKSEGAVDRKPEGRMKMKSRTKKPSPAKGKSSKKKLGKK